jgi:hypothetical protein
VEVFVDCAMATAYERYSARNPPKSEGLVGAVVHAVFPNAEKAWQATANRSTRYNRLKEAREVKSSTALATIVYYNALYSVVFFAMHVLLFSWKTDNYNGWR